MITAGLNLPSGDKPRRPTSNHREPPTGAPLADANWRWMAHTFLLIWIYLHIWGSIKYKWKQPSNHLANFAKSAFTYILPQNRDELLYQTTNLAEAWCRCLEKSNHECHNQHRVQNSSSWTLISWLINDGNRLLPCCNLMKSLIY